MSKAFCASWNKFFWFKFYSFTIEFKQSYTHNSVSDKSSSQVLNWLKLFIDNSSFIPLHCTMKFWNYMRWKSSLNTYFKSHKPLESTKCFCTRYKNIICSVMLKMNLKNDSLQRGCKFQVNGFGAYIPFRKKTAFCCVLNGVLFILLMMILVYTRS